MRKEEAEAILKKYHARIFSKKSNLSKGNDNDLEIFNVFQKFSQKIKPLAPVQIK
jgi:hypothetical protein